MIGTAKYSIDEFIPIVGGFTADTIELFIKCMGSIKTSSVWHHTDCDIDLDTIIKILAISVIYKVTALLIEPIASKKLSNGIGDIGTSLVTMGAILFFASLLFIIFITSIINLGVS